MKKLIAVAVAIIAVVAIGVALVPSTTQQSYIRIHIRANSNLDIDQAVKYVVKDRVVGYITPLAKDINSYDAMYDVLGSNLSAIKSCVDTALKANNFNYTSTIRLNKEEFPPRTYQDLTLGGGIYDALIIELGSGEGDNWWCVAFPPLCFSEGGGGDTVYKSKVKEWIDKLSR